MTDERTPIEAVVRALLAGLTPLSSERVDVGRAAGRVLAGPILSPTDLPPRDRAAMDGFAVRAADTRPTPGEGRVRLRVDGEARAGAPDERHMQAGACRRISTGADLPPGADAIVRVERADDEGASVLLHGPVHPGTDVRAAGEDARRDAVLADGGMVLGPLRVAGLAGAGVVDVGVHRRPVVLVLPTGDEILAGTTADALSPALAALLARDGAIVDVAPVLPDDAAVLRESVEKALGHADLVVTTGGASVGPHDHAGQVAADLGGTTASLALRPGRPFAHAKVGDSVLTCLPGSPVAALAVATLLVRPVVRRLAGLPPPQPTELTAGAAIAPTADRLRHLVPVQVTDRVRPVAGNGSADLARLAGADGFADVPSGTVVASGDRVAVWGLP